MDHIELTNLIIDEISIQFHCINEIKNLIRFEFVVDVLSRKRQLRTDVVSDEVDSLGSMVIPLPDNGYFYILIRKDLQKSYEMVETISHELIHLVDYLSFSKKYTHSKVEAITNHDYWLALYFYSEMRAKQIGYLTYFKFLKNQKLLNGSVSLQLDCLSMIGTIFENSKYSLSVSISNLKKSYPGSAVKVLYNFVRHVGLILCFSELYPSIYSLNNEIVKVYDGNLEYINKITKLAKLDVDTVDFQLFIMNLRKIAEYYGIYLE
ncbi:MAG: hypothetical protein A2Y45_05090 [Tenericutes bacterium GWC2_34_14]|jgi:hypothetical protein|nr:hypothetical protein [Bacillota bacterium]OHE28003.1 MAG: hypothetical protein A2Y45_05090 [Tenericutes bacterium GWC2_34_14]OHE33920.1 MAG: hypothetical protein A2012_07500 [Tenericutes bacterium GWE2_34_108]OHE36517.1 MAG: hypothetical protein A2Y46_05660 [Tenericutes bacterium GWF1_35_14]OHE37765.1 MAG: hypothetical protein A2Y44_10245 [Tenericutes bacterium GWF2_35_184]OHE44483.1 MAG: hypothetical protein A3K26_02520 [Tenericutes bacterium RIFOXYA12_FULL_35_10]OHE45178.1 MAG: hypotheti